MKLIFVDETGDAKFKEYFGLCVAAVDSSHYRNIKDSFHGLLRAHGWNEAVEFKGAYLFSATKGDTAIHVDQRVEIARNVLDLCSANKNSRINFYYHSSKNSKDHKTSYLNSIGPALRRALNKPKGKGRRDTALVSVSCDNQNGVSVPKIRQVIAPVIREKKYHLFEDVQMIESNFETVGILFADIVAYLAARIDTISNDSELFENLDPEIVKANGKLMKLKSSTELLERVKKISWHEIAT